MDYGHLPTTGMAALVIGGVSFDQAHLISAALLIVFAGVALVKLSFRRGKKLNEA